MKKIMVSVAIFLLCLNMAAVAQSPNWLWAKTAGNINGNEYGIDITTDASGNVYALGFAQGGTLTFGNYTLNNPGLFIVKYNSTGTVMWATGSEYGVNSGAINVDAGGNVYVTGSFRTDSVIFGNYTLHNANGGNTNSSDFFLAKYDAAGNLAWAKSAGGTNDEYGTTVKADANGNIYVSGSFYGSTFVLGGTTLTNTSGGSFFLAKYSSSGTVLWAKSAAGKCYSFSQSMGIDANNNIYVTGTFGGHTLTFESTILTSADSSNAGNNAGDLFIVKYSSAGNVAWAKSAGGIGYDASFGISTDAAGNSYMAGAFSSPSLTLEGHTLTEPGFFIAKYNASGNVAWANTVSGDFNSRSFSIDIKANLYLAGYFQDSITIGTTTLINSAAGKVAGICIAKYDSTGTPVWAKSAIGRSIDTTYYYDNSPNAICADASGYVYVTGDLRSDTIRFGTIAGLHSPYGFLDGDYFIAKISNCILPPPPVNTTATPAQTICSGNHTTLTATGTGALGWYSASSGGTFLGAGGSFITPVLTSPTTYYVQDSTCGATTRTAITVTVNPKPSPVITRNGNVLNTGTFTTYQWLLNGAAINTANGQSYTPASNGAYRVAVSNSYGCNDTSAIYTFCPLPASPSNTTATPAQTICSGNRTTLTATGTGTLGWYTALSGGTYLAAGGNFVTPVLTSPAIYYVQDSNSCGASARTAIGIAVRAKPAAAISRVGNTLITGVFLSYQWLVDGSVIDSATEQLYTLTANGGYQVVVADTSGCTDTSAVYQVTGVNISNIRQAGSVHLYPNPTNGKIYADGIQSGNTIEFYNVLGETVFFSKVESDHYSINLLGNAKGIYFYRISDRSAVIQQGKIIIE